MDPSRFHYSYLIGLALEQQWPVMLLSVLVCAVAWLTRIERVPAALRARTVWLSSPGVLISAPVYLWGCGAAFDSLRVMDYLARSAFSSGQTGWIDHIWAIHLSQFVALFAVILPGFVTATTGDSAIKSKDVAGALWAIAAIAIDALFFLRMVTPIGIPS